MLRFALFGAGRAGRIHGRNIAAHPRAELVFVHDVNREAAERLCGEYGGRVAAGPEAICDLLRWLTGEEPIEVFATGSCLIDPGIGEAGDVDTAMVVLRMPDGALCHIENSRRAVYGFDERIEVLGERGMLQASPARASQLAHFSAAGIRLGRTHDYYEESFAATLHAFIRDVEAGVPLQPDLTDGLRAQLIAEAAVESLATNRPVPLSG